MTRRERLENRAETRRRWAERRRERSEAGFRRAAAIAENIPLGQPILIGHHSEKHHRRDIARIDSGMREGCESAKMANHHDSKADGIEAALDSSIFSDDHDAIPALEARIAAREAEKDRIKAYNASCRKAAKTGARGDLSLLDEAQRRSIESTARVCPYQIGVGGSFPAYVLANINGRIKADRDRLENIKRMQSNTQAAIEAGGVIVKRLAAQNWCVVCFAEKPDRATLNALRSAGYRWTGGTWQGRLDVLPALECFATSGGAA